MLDLIGTAVCKVYRWCFNTHSTTSGHHLDLHPLSSKPDWSFHARNSTRLTGGHGEDIIRAMRLNEIVNPPPIQRRCPNLIPLTSTDIHRLHRRRRRPRQSLADIQKRRDAIDTGDGERCKKAKKAGQKGEVQAILTLICRQILTRGRKEIYAMCRA